MKLNRNNSYYKLRHIKFIKKEISKELLQASYQEIYDYLISKSKRYSKELDEEINKLYTNLLIKDFNNFL